MLTLQDLKWIVKEPKIEKKVPTARHLLEQGEKVVSMENGGGVQLSVFCEGYALYRVGKYTTVFPVYSCGDYYYENEGQKICVDADFFEGQEWYVRLLLGGKIVWQRTGIHIAREGWFLTMLSRRNGFYWLLRHCCHWSS